jgi:hypothetical protein
MLVPLGKTFIRKYKEPCPEALVESAQQKYKTFRG